MTDDKARFDVPTWWQQTAFLEFRNLYILKKKNPLFFIGSGLSIGAGLPNWRTLLLTLAQMHDEEAPSSAPIYSKVASRVNQSVKDQTNYLQAGTDIEEAFGRESFRKAINSILNDETRLPKSSSTHDAIAALRWSRIITTNYDVLIERAAKAVKGSRYEVLTTHPDKETFWEVEPADFERRSILKIHGDIADNLSKLILSESSFQQRYSAQDQEKFVPVLRTVLRSSPVTLFLGYGHADPYIRTLFSEVLRKAVAKQNVFALIPREGDPAMFTKHLQELAEQDIRVITYSPDDAHRELLEFLQYFTAASAHDTRYERRLRRRRPTVVMLHCGGTIGSAATHIDSDTNDQLQVIVKQSRYDTGLRESSDRLLEWYQTSHNSGEPVQINIVWEVLPVAFQMFSENASYVLWNAVSTKLEEVIYKYFHANANPDGMLDDERLIDLYAEERRQYESAQLPGELTEKMFRDDFCGRYVLGIVLHFGTDTLVYAATALALSLQHLPCPIVITGANQPPREENITAARGWVYATSDAWTNLMNTIYFLQSFGHRLTEVFVCFGETVHNAINLRKRGKEIIPSGHGGRTPRHVEPFAFRNLSQRGQYMFRLIDGLFCNNYYPNPVHYDMVFDRKEFGDLRHIRFDAVSREVPKATVMESFQPRVTYVEVNPCFPLIDLQTMVRDGLYVVVAQGYASGTYPSVPSHPFTRLLEDAHRLGVPIVLVSRYGILPSQQEYAVENPSTDHATVLSLYQIIAETAVPLLSLITSRIAKDTWAAQPGEDADTTLRRRKQYLAEGIGRLFGERPNILSFELKNVANKNAMSAEMTDMQVLREEQRKQRRIEDDGISIYLTDTASTLHAGGEQPVVLSRHDVMQLLEELPHVFEKVEAGADGLETVFNLGFDYGVRLWRACEEERPSTTQSETDEFLTDGVDRFFELQNPQIKEQRLKTIREILASVQTTANASGLLQMDAAPSLKVAERNNRTTERATAPGAFTIQFRIKRLDHTAHDERYAVMVFSQEERQFFEKMWRGPQEDNTAQFDHELRDHYNTLLHKTWTHSAGTADWFVFGLSKGVAFGVATALRIDRVASHAEADPRFLLWFRKMMKTSIRSTDEHAWQIAYTCSELQQRDDEAARTLP